MVADSREDIWQVEYAGESFGVTRATFVLERAGKITNKEYKNIPEDLEVEGNIYENPELMS